MSDIDALRQRFEAAEQSFGLIDEREQKYSERLIHLIGSIEQELQEHRDEIAWRDARLVALERENGELRAMMHSLLQAIEDGGRDRIGAVVSDLDQRVTSFLSDDQAPVPQPSEAVEPEREEPEPDPVSVSEKIGDLEIVEEKCPKEAADEASQEIEPADEPADEAAERPEGESAAGNGDPTEQIARLLASEGESDSSVRDIIERVTKLAATVAPAGQALLDQSASGPESREATEEIDLTADSDTESDALIEACEPDEIAAA